ncbi:MAG: carbon monoxide dehydrogenase G protein [Ktedonobacterales bacterium]|jgi:carbon monoxide dehydrogenase subunit G|nr:MAG: carbon monoxide dehydrogenase G protein [Ktedonobacterales bacterium]
MQFTGTQQINAPAQKVWDFMLDPNMVASCAPGFQSMEILAPDHFKPTVAVGVGAVKAKFTLDVQLEDVRPPDHAGVRGRGNAVGSAVELHGAMDLTPVSDTETTMNWTADVIVNGVIASVGARLLEGTAQKLTARFFDCFRQKLEAPETPAASEAPATPSTPDASDTGNT